MASKYKNWIYVFIAIVMLLVIVKKCDQETKTVTKTKVVYKTKTDTIKEKIIQEVPKKVYVDRIKTIKGKDSIIYVDKPTGTTTIANKFDAEVKSNDATAKLNITTTGQLLDVTGTIQWKEKKTTSTTTIIKPKSGLFLYGETSILPTFKRAEIGLDYQIRNTLIIGTSVSYDDISKQTYANAKVGFRIF